MKRLLVPVKLLFILCLMILVATGAIGVAGANGTSGAAKTPKPLLDAIHSFRSPISQDVTANPGDDDEASVPVQGGSWVYTVKRGDSLYSIAQRFGFTVEKLRSYNGLSSNNLRIGQRLTIPPASQAQKSNALASGDVDMLARLIHAEAQAEPYTGKVAVGAVVLNRTRAPGFPDPVAGVS